MADFTIISRIKDKPDDDDVLYSLEVFPPRNPAGLPKLKETLMCLKELNPLFIDVTFGAGGGTRDTTIDVADFIQNQVCVPCMMHLTCTGSTMDSINAILETCRARNISNIMALRGDKMGDGCEITDFVYATDLVKHIRTRFGQTFGLGVAGYPERHPEAPDLATDLGHLKEKLDAGADMVVTQLFFDAAKFLEFQAAVRAMGATTPIVPGIMMLSSYAGFKRIMPLCSTTTLPPQFAARVEELKDRPAAEFQAFGVQHAIAMCKELFAAGVRMFHFYTLNNSGPTRQVLEALQWLKKSSPKLPTAEKPKDI